MKYIDPENWKRNKHFKFFKQFKHPHFNICTDIEISKTYIFTRRKKISIFVAVLFAVMKTCNHFEEFRYRIKGEHVVLYDKVHPGITLLIENDIYGNCIMNFKDTFEEFLKEYDLRVSAAKKKIVVGEKQKGRDDLVYISSLPWISFTSVTNPMKGDPQDSIPRIIWGKQFKRDGKIMMPISVQVNHSLMDGIHVSKFLIKLTELLKEPEKLF